MNIEAFAWYAGSTGLLALPEGSEVRVPFNDRAAVEFALKKELLRGAWAPKSLFTLEALTPGGREILEALLGNPALRQAVEAEFPTATRFHVKSVRRFIAAWKPAA